MSSRKKMKFAAILEKYPYSSKDVKRMEKLIEGGMDLEKEYKAVMDKSSPYSRAMRDLIVFCWVNRKGIAKDMKKETEQEKVQAKQNFMRRYLNKLFKERKNG